MKGRVVYATLPPGRPAHRPSGRLNLNLEKKVLGSCRKVMIKYAIMKTKKDLTGSLFTAPEKTYGKARTRRNLLIA